MHLYVNMLRQIVLFDFNLVLFLQGKRCLLVHLSILEFKRIGELLRLPLFLFLIIALVADVPAARPAVVEELATVNAASPAAITIGAAAVFRRRANDPLKAAFASATGGDESLLIVARRVQSAIVRLLGRLKGLEQHIGI
jgi:hypothetical protein